MVESKHGASRYHVYVGSSNKSKDKQDVSHHYIGLGHGPVKLYKAK